MPPPSTSLNPEGRLLKSIRRSEVRHASGIQFKLESTPLPQAVSIACECIDAASSICQLGSASSFTHISAYFHTTSKLHDSLKSIADPPLRIWTCVQREVYQTCITGPCNMILEMRTQCDHDKARTDSLAKELSRSMIKNDGLYLPSPRIQTIKNESSRCHSGHCTSYQTLISLDSSRNLFKHPP